MTQLPNTQASEYLAQTIRGQLISGADIRRLFKFGRINFIILKCARGFPMSCARIGFNKFYYYREIVAFMQISGYGSRCPSKMQVAREFRPDLVEALKAEIYHKSY